jgi:glycerol-3-phosphate dehydrogenase (NAD(P)+)
MRLGVNMGARRETFFGLSGIGDMITTCVNPHSRNHFVGEQLGRGKKLKDILAKMEMVAEGVPTTASAYGLAKKYRVEMPITQEVYAVLYKSEQPKTALRRLMTRQKKSEQLS